MNLGRSNMLFYPFLFAEGVGFEPTVSFHPLLFSGQMHSTSMRPLPRDNYVSSYYTSRKAEIRNTRCAVKVLEICGNQRYGLLVVGANLEEEVPRDGCPDYKTKDIHGDDRN